MMCKFLTYSLTLLTIVAGLFVVSACQKDDVGKSEVMMTFNTRAIVSDAVSDADALERMNDLRVIMVRQDGTVVDNHLANEINASSVKFTFSTPVKTGGEYFTFYAVANENALTPVPTESNELSWMKKCKRYVELTEQNITAIKAQQIGNGSAFTIPNGEAIPQTKIWTVYVPQQDKYAVPDPLQLEYVASKISVKFVNQTNEQQTLSNIHITGITPNGKGRLFSDYVKDGTHDSYSEVYVESDVQPANNPIPFSNVESLAATKTSAVQTYYTYPVDAANISNPMLYATWGGKEFHMPIGVTSIPRNKHIEIVVNIIKDKLTVDYNVKDWKEHELNIGGAPTAPDKSDGYYVEDWFADNNIEIGGENKNGWNVAPGVTITGKEVWHWETDIDILENDRQEIPVPSEFLVPGYELLFNFMCVNPNGDDPESIQIEFRNANDDVLVEDATSNDKTYIWDTTANYYRYFTLTERVIELINKGWSKNLVLKTINLTYPENPVHIKIIKLFIVDPDNGGASTDAEQQ